MLIRDLWKILLYGFIVSIGLFECGHLAGVFFGSSISGCGTIVLGLMGVIVVLALVLLWRRGKQIFSGTDEKKVCKPGIVHVVFLLLVFSQIYYIFTADILQTPGDIMLETVNSFLASDGVYRVSPLTGKAMTGMPMRYKILCLPTAYTVLCRWFGGGTELIVGRVVPTAVLFMTYMSYYLLGGTLFHEDELGKKKRMWFLVILGMLFWLCEGSVYMEGYGVLHAGYLGTTIRGGILVPLCLYGALERKWMVSVICIFAEACIVWTFWGFGVCAVVLAGVIFIDFLCNNEQVRRITPGLTGKGGEIQ